MSGILSKFLILSIVIAFTSIAVFGVYSGGEKPHIVIHAEEITSIGPLPITNSLIMSWAAMAVIIVVGLAFAKNKRAIPTGIQNFGETIIEKGFNFFMSVMGSRKKTEKVFPLVATLFIFILLSNWMGLIPGIGSIGQIHINEAGQEELIPFLRPAYADLNMTLALSIIAVSATHIFGIMELGKRAHLGKYINFSSPIKFFVGILELFGEISKIISFSFRLFGNIFAGEVLLIVIIFLIPYIAPLPFFGMEVFFGFIQALVFSMLTLVFIQVATTEARH